MTEGDGSPAPRRPVPPAEPAPLHVEGVTKRFAAVRALHDVTLDFPAGRVTALVGENGAGKSTLVKILGGDHRPDTGRMLLAGRPFAPHSPADARRRGVRVVAQEPEIIPDVPVGENVYVGSLPTRRGRLLDRRGLRARVQADLARLGFAHLLDPDLPGRRLTPAQRQLVEIMRALSTEAKVIAFDEPTSSLSEYEVDALFRLIRSLRDSGHAIVYVSHRLPEILRLADRIAVLRDGALVGVTDAADTDEADIVRMMVGRDLSAAFSRPRAPCGPVALEVTGLTTDAVRDVHLRVRTGEVVGLAGLVGAGRSELARAITGDLPVRRGTVAVNGTSIRLRRPGDAVAAGIGHAPEERKAQALFPYRSVRDNVSIAVLPALRRLRFVRRAAERALVRGYVERLRVRAASIEHEVRALSGGNQQKVVLARWLARRPTVLILDEPTRGIDVGAKAEIYRIVADLAAAGVAILLISSELPEVLGLADRIVVMHDGRVTGELDGDEATEEAVLALAMAGDRLAADSPPPGARSAGGPSPGGPSTDDPSADDRHSRDPSPDDAPSAAPPADAPEDHPPGDPA